MDNKIYWLFSANYLVPFKGYFDTKKAVKKKIVKLIKHSEQAYKRSLKKEAIKEDLNNMQNLDDWKGFSFHEIKASINLLEIDTDEVTQEERELIFKKRLA